MTAPGPRLNRRQIESLAVLFVLTVFLWNTVVVYPVKMLVVVNY